MSRTIFSINTSPDSLFLASSGPEDHLRRNELTEKSVSGKCLNLFNIILL